MEIKPSEAAKFDKEQKEKLIKKGKKKKSSKQSTKTSADKVKEDKQKVVSINATQDKGSDSEEEQLDQASDDDEK